MNLKTIFFTGSAILSVGCSEVEVLTGNSYEEHGIYKIFSSKTEFSSRVTSDGAWENGDAIGLYVFESESGKVTSAGINVKYNAAVKDGNAVFSPENTAAVIPDVNSDFVAYYPFSEDVAKIDKEAAVYKIDLSDQTSGFKNHDLIYAKLENQSFPALSGDGLSMDFSHKLSLVQVNVRGLGTDETVNSITVSGLNTTANFDLVEGVIKNEGNIGNIKLQKLSENSFVGVMLPTTTLAGMKISIETTGARKFQYSPKDENTITEFVAGNKYVYEITASESSDEDDSEISDEILNGYEQIKVHSGTSEISQLLQGKTGKVALIFDAVNYNTTGITIPETITDLMLYGKSGSVLSNTLDGLPHISFSSSGISFTDSKFSTLTFVGVEMSGNEKDALIGRNIFSNGGQVIVKDCKIHDFNNILHVDGTPEGNTISVNIENSIINNSVDLVWRYSLSSFSLKNSTVYDMNVIARSSNMEEITIENCTLVDFSATLVEDSGNLIFNNNILSSFATADNKDNLCYKIKGINGFTGNFYASSSDGKFPMIQNNHNDIDASLYPNAWQSKNNVFDGANANATEGKFYTTISTAGDPRWRQTETTSVK